MSNSICHSSLVGHDERSLTLALQEESTTNTFFLEKLTWNGGHYPFLQDINKNALYPFYPGLFDFETRSDLDAALAACSRFPSIVGVNDAMNSLLRLDVPETVCPELDNLFSPVFQMSLAGRFRSITFLPATLAVIYEQMLLDFSSLPGFRFPQGNGSRKAIFQDCQVQRYNQNAVIIWKTSTAGPCIWSELLDAIIPRDYDTVACRRLSRILSWMQYYRTLEAGNVCSCLEADTLYHWEESVDRLRALVDTEIYWLPCVTQRGVGMDLDDRTDTRNLYLRETSGQDFYIVPNPRYFLHFALTVNTLGVEVLM